MEMARGVAIDGGGWTWPQGLSKKVALGLCMAWFGAWPSTKGRGCAFAEERVSARAPGCARAVSYTHLTLPTIYSV